MEFISFETLNSGNYDYLGEQEQGPQTPTNMPDLAYESEIDNDYNDYNDYNDNNDNNDNNKDEETTQDIMLYIDSLFMHSGFMSMEENIELKENIITRLYASSSGLYISIKCGLPYKCSFVYDKTINYMYPNVMELTEYVSDHNNLETNLLESYKYIEKDKIQPETFEVVIYRERFPNVGNTFLQIFNEKFEKCTNYSVSKNNVAIIITYAPLRKETNRLSIESLIKFFNPSW